MPQCMQLTDTELAAKLAAGWTVNGNPHPSQADCLAVCGSSSISPSLTPSSTSPIQSSQSPSAVPSSVSPSIRPSSLSAIGSSPQVSTSPTISQSPSTSVRPSTSASPAPSVSAASSVSASASAGGGGGGITTPCCPANPIPTTLYLTLTNTNPGCTCANGLVIPLVYDTLSNVWKGLSNVCGLSYSFTLTCVTFGLNNGQFELQVGISASYALDAFATCNPFSWTQHTSASSFCLLVDVTFTITA